MAEATCRLCGAQLTETFVDLGMSPLCESFISADRLDGPETFYPLHVRICTEWLLVQLPAYVPGEIQGPSPDGHTPRSPAARRREPARRVR